MKLSNTAVKNISLVIGSIITLVICFYLGAFMLTFDAINAIDSDMVLALALTSCLIQGFVSYKLQANSDEMKIMDTVLVTIAIMIASLVSIEIATSMIPWIIVSLLVLLFKKK